MDNENLIKKENIINYNNNISNISQDPIKYISFTKMNNNYLEVINNQINLLKELFYNNYIKSTDELIKNKVVSTFTHIFSILNLITKKKENIFSLYESILRKNEGKVRQLYSDIFTLKIKNIYSENLVENLLQKEKEYNLIKEKTGIFVQNGTVIFNDRKDNEIFILRQENSNLKAAINKNENELNQLKKVYKKDKYDFQEKISKLNYKINILKNQIQTNDYNPKIKSKNNFQLLSSNELNKTYNKNKNRITKKTASLKKNFLINKNMFLNQCTSNGILDLKNKIEKKFNDLDKENKAKIPFLKMNHINKSDIYDKKILYLTPRNQINDIKITNYHILHQNTEAKKRSINKTIFITNNSQIIINSKNKVNKNYNIILKKRKMNIKQQLNRSTNFPLNNPLLSSSPVKINKIYFFNHKIKKIEKDNNISSKNLKIVNLKRKRNISNIIINKSYDILNNLNLASIGQKNISKSPISNYKSKFLILKN